MLTISFVCVACMLFSFSFFFVPCLLVQYCFPAMLLFRISHFVALVVFV